MLSLLNTTSARDVFIFTRLKPKNKVLNSEPFGEESLEHMERKASLLLDLVQTFQQELWDQQSESCFTQTELNILID